MSLIIDPQVAGLAGNMFIGAFVDLGADKKKIEKVILDYSRYFGKVEVHIDEKIKNGLKTTYADISTEDNTSRHYEDIIRKIDEITEEKYSDDTLIKKSIELSKKVFHTIAIAESEVHGKKLDEIHFHEVGCADAVADIIGSCYAYHLLGLDKEKVYSLPVATGNGSIKTQHGILPIPAPAVIKILEDTPTLGGMANTELATPTGSAILVNIVDEYVERAPIMKKKIVGYGSGKKDLEILNALRLIRAEEYAEVNTITVLETNVDTLSGEILGNLFEKLLKEGARDVSITPTVMKKNRPGHIIKVITRNNTAEHLVNVLIEETGTLGVRMIPYMHRGVVFRENISHKIVINGVEEEVRFKVGYLGEKIIKCNPEYDDLKILSNKHDIPLKDLKEQIEKDYKEKNQL